MRNFKTFIGLLFITALYSACSNRTDKFVGKWSPINNTILPTTFVLTIQKTDDQITMVNSQNPDRPLPLTYLERDKTMTGEVQGTPVHLSLNDDTGNLLFRPDSNADPIEFKKLD
ncbi:hypothetical protein [Pedobacter sp. KACC 23697]|uniref:DUF3876 domain-containing protein n=1 Tax=Pedobacter sp. KACC 23697 TaxID=3149230 RepID=A0AAU7K5U4_9SPHI